MTTIGYLFSCNHKTVLETQRNFWMMKISFYQSSTRLALRPMSYAAGLLRFRQLAIPLEVEFFHQCNSHIFINGPLYEVDTLELGKTNVHGQVKNHGTLISQVRDGWRPTLPQHRGGTIAHSGTSRQHRSIQETDPNLQFSDH